MEFNEKLQQLRKQKGLTQDELARELYVSRTAVSKWESGRGYPGIDSLRAIAAFFSVTVDELLSGEQVLHIAQIDNSQKQSHLRDMVYGLLDCSASLFLFMPFFGRELDGAVSSSSLLTLTDTAIYIKAAYFAVVIAIMIWGILTLALQNCPNSIWNNIKSKISLVLNIAAVLLFVISLQPYAAVFVFVFLIIKAILLIKKP
ncbi:MAG: helix-turn-helix transcriptional regulator [Clostridia bacterium]|nr:helix-turn-helix transcriptional regulator [Clostridia bacterium]